MPDTNEPLLTLHAPLHPTFQRGKQWYVVSGAIVIAITAYGIVSGEWSLAILAPLVAMAYFLVRDHKPESKEVVVTQQGIRVDEKFAAWADLKGYWFFFAPDGIELRFTYQKESRADLTLQIESSSLQKVRDALSPFLAELSDKHDGLLDSLARLLKL